MHSPYPLLISTVGTCVLLCSICADAGELTTTQIQQQLRILRDAITSGKIARFEICHRPYEIEVAGIGNAEMLEQDCEIKVSVTDLEATRIVKGLIGALDKTRFGPATRKVDPRWGVIFYGEKGLRQFSIFLDRFGHNAVVNGTLVGVNSPLKDWLEKKFLQLFR